MKHQKQYREDSKPTAKIIQDKMEYYETIVQNPESYQEYKRSNREAVARYELTHAE